jgi:predicted secreted hydrolase
MKKIIISILIISLLFSVEISKVELVEGEPNTVQIVNQIQNLPKPPTSRISPFRHIIGSNDEGSHNRNNSYHQEWWYYIGFFNGEDSELKNWSMMVSFNQMGVLDMLFCAIFDENETSYGGVTNKWKGAMNASRPNVNVTFLNSTVKGRYPKWDIYAEKIKLNGEIVIVNVTYTANSLPMWLFRNMGHNRSKSHLSHYCIINSTINGTVRINETTYKVNGFGYHEHSWINVKQRNRPRLFSLPKKQENKNDGAPNWQLILNAWDWGSIFLDNGWNIFVAKMCRQSRFSRILPGTLWITPDGENFTECRYFQFKYLETKQTSIPSIEVPTKIHVKGYFFKVFARHPFKGLVRLDLIIEQENLREFTWIGTNLSAGVWEGPCKVYGTLKWGRNCVELNGHAMLELTRATKTN